MMLMLLVVCLAEVNGESAIPGLVGSIPVTHPAFTTLSRNTSETNPQKMWNLIITRFNGIPFSHDYVSVVRGIGSYMGSLGKAKVEDISSDTHWPNEAGAIPNEVFGRGNMVVIPSGFLVPTKTKGALTIFDLGADDPTEQYDIIPDDGSNWFYHRAIWLDMDGDGKLDVVTCRANKPIIGQEKGQMIWLKQPNVPQPWTTKWQLEVLTEGDGAPDTFLIPANMTNTDGKRVQTILTAGYFSKSLDVWWRKSEAEAWSEENINKRVIDNTEGAAFDLLYADVDKDGREELIVTYNKVVNGSVIVYYAMDGDFRSGSVNKTLIADGFNSATQGQGKGAPGSIKLSWPTATNQTGRPDLILSGDDNGQLFLLRPVEHTRWQYDKHMILTEAPGTMGEVAVGDINMDGYTDIVVPSYSKDRVKILSYNNPTLFWQRLQHVVNTVVENIEAATLNI